MAGSYLQTFQISLGDIDRQISDSTLRIGGLTFAQLEPLIDSVDVTVFELHTPDPFYCPSGVNQEFHSVDPAVATAYKHRLVPTFRLWVQERR